MGAYRYRVVSLPQQKNLPRGVDVIDAMNTELDDLAEAGWEVAAFDRASQLGPGTFVLRMLR